MDPLLYEKRDDQIAILTFNRPDKMNALSTALLGQLDDTLHQIEADPAIRVVILTGAGEKAFVAGADIGEYAGQTFAQFVDYQLNARRLFDYLAGFPKPVIGAINGYALGGGFEIALCCDVLVASRNAQFGLPEGLLGLSPGGGGTQRLTRAVGRYVAADVLLSARRLKADYAYQLGLVAEVTEPDQLMDRALAKAGYVLRVAPLSIREMKRLIRQGLDSSLEAALSLEQEVLFRLYNTADAAEGIRAFVNKRDAQFKGE
jgi:enoyl-CoA hydratase/carnithine racemase